MNRHAEEATRLLAEAVSLAVMNRNAAIQYAAQASLEMERIGLPAATTARIQGNLMASIIWIRDKPCLFTAYCKAAIAEIEILAPEES